MQKELAGALCKLTWGAGGCKLMEDLQHGVSSHILLDRKGKQHPLDECFPDNPRKMGWKVASGWKRWSSAKTQQSYSVSANCTPSLGTATEGDKGIIWH